MRRPIASNSNQLYSMFLSLANRVLKDKKQDPAIIAGALLGF